MNEKSILDDGDHCCWSESDVGVVFGRLDLFWNYPHQKYGWKINILLHIQVFGTFVIICHQNLFISLGYCKNIHSSIYHNKKFLEFMKHWKMNITLCCHGWVWKLFTVDQNMLNYRSNFCSELFYLLLHAFIIFNFSVNISYYRTWKSSQSTVQNCGFHFNNMMKYKTKHFIHNNDLVIYLKIWDNNAVFPMTHKRISLTKDPQNFHSNYKRYKNLSWI